MAIGSNYIFKPFGSSASGSVNSSFELENLSIVCSVATNALTIAVKGQDGNDPSSSNICTVGVRSATLTSGAYNLRQITSALSMTVSSGSTLGTLDALQAYLYVYLIDNAGTLELAISHVLYNEPSVVTTTAEGGAGAADSGTGQVPRNAPDRM